MGYLKLISIISLLIQMSACVPVPNQTNIRAQNLGLGAAPESSVTSFSPSKTLPDGGATLTIIGSNLDIAREVRVGSQICEDVQYLSLSSITCTLPSLDEGDYFINIENKFGKVSQSSSKISYLYSPEISSIAPSGGPLAGGNTITINGRGFILGIAVEVGGNPCRNTIYIDSTKITCRPDPSTAGAVDVVVTNTNSETATLPNAYTYADAPTFTSITNTTGKAAGGETVNILGANFQTGVTVSIGGANCDSLTFTSSTNISCTTPSGVAGARDIIITNPDTQSVTATAAFTYINPPTITSLDFSSGSTVGGEMITVNGYDFDTGATVFIGGSACVVTYRAPSGDLINCTTPAQTNGSYDVTVINSFDLQQSTLADGFTYNSNPFVNRSPTISAITPDGGAVAGSTAVTITGSGFYDGAVVTIGGNPCTSLTVVSDTSLTCNSPAGTLNNIEGVQVTNLNTLNATLSSAFQYRNGPSVSSVSPFEIPAAGGVEITITGTDFLATPLPSIKIDGVDCTNIAYDNSTQLRCTPSASSAGFKNIQVTNYDAQTDVLPATLELIDPPTITSISPTTSPFGGGGTLTITGTNFRTTPSVTVGGNDCTGPILFGSTTVTCTIPAGTANTTVDVELTNGSQDAQSVVYAASLSYEGPPTVSSVTPTAGALGGGTSLTITGLGFKAGATVNINGVACSPVNFISSTSLTCTTGINPAGTYDIVVTNLDSQLGTLASAYTYQAGPTLTSINVSSGPSIGGTAITLDGSDFLSGATVDFGGTACNNVNFVSAIQLTCTTPAHADGLVDVTVTNPDNQTSSISDAFTFIPAPIIDSISPASGFASGGTTVTITGNHFDQALVNIGGFSCNVTAQSATSITCTTTSALKGTYDVIVTNIDSQTANLPSSYTYYGPPVILSITPDGGAVNGGTNLSIIGTDFQQGASVTVGTNDCPVDAVVGTTVILCTTSTNSGVVETLDITVTNPDTQANLPFSAFDYRLGPVITLVTPNEGYSSGATSITLTGTDFIAGASIFFGETACDQVSVVSDTSITCSTPSKPAGLSDIRIIHNDGQEYTLTDAFTFRDPPIVTSVSPTAGALAGGTEITISGSKFYDGALTIDVGGVNCTSPTFVDSSTLTCTTGANTEGIKAVTVTNPDGQTGTKPSAYNYQPGPSISSISPIGGNYIGGTFVTISGSVFRPGITASVGGKDCNNLSYIDANTLTCVTSAKSRFFEIQTVADVTNSLDGKYFIFNIPNSSLGIWFDVGDSGTAEPAHGASSGLEISTVILNDDAATVASKLATAIDALEFFEASSDGDKVSITYLLEGAYDNPTAGDSGFSIFSIPASDILVTNTDNQSATLVDGYTYREAPTISAVSPTSGKITGGDIVTITGTRFLSGASVKIGAVDCGSLSVDSDTQITCTIGAQSAGVYNVTITNPDEQAASLFSSFTYKGPPVISSITPSAGAIAGGTPVQITGSEFVNGISVTIGGLNCASVNYISDTLISCTTTGTSTGIKDVVVENPDTQTGSLVGGFTYRAAPAISSFSPNGGNPAGDTALTINGSNFFPGVEVSINGLSCTSLVLVSSSTITCNTPAQTGSYPITVTNNDFQTTNSGTNYNYQDAPTISSVTTPSGVAAGPLAGASTLTINGANFLAGAVVNLGGSNCPVSSVTASSITCTTPPGPLGLADLIVTNSDNQSASLLSAFEYRNAPTLSSISPVAGALGGNTLVTLTGADLRGVTDINFDGLPCSSIDQIDSTTVQCLTPAHSAGVVNIILINEDDQQTNLNNAYTYQVGPSISTVNPSDGPLAGNTNITISGSNFALGSQAQIGSQACLSTTYISSSDLICLSPAQAAGAYDVVVTNPDNQIATASLAFTYLEAPVLNSPVVPDNGGIDGGTELTLSGQYFLPGASVDLSGSPCNVTSLTNVEIVCTTSARASGLIDITITNPDGQSVTLSNAYTYNPVPTIVSINPALGPSFGGTTVQLSGTNFIDGLSIDIGGVACTNVVVTDSNTASCVTANSPIGLYSVVLTNPDGQSANLLNSYRFLGTPSITSISPNQINPSGGTVITINGTNFGDGIIARVDGISCLSVNFISSTEINCIAPPRSIGSYDVNVINPDGQVNLLADGLAYAEGPVISSISPLKGAFGGGTSLSLFGSNFDPGATVSIDGNNCSNVQWISSGELVCTTPSGNVAGDADVRIENPDTQNNTLINGYNYQLAPTLTSISPDGGPLNGGQTVTITGTGFFSGSSVSIGGAACINVNVSSSTTLSCDTTTLTAGSYDVVFTNDDGQVVTLASAYTYQEAPTVLSVSPAEGFSSGGTNIQIIGSNFISTLPINVTLGGVACTGVTWINSGQIDCTTAAGGPGAVDVVVTNYDNQSGTLGSGFNYRAPPVASAVSPTGGNPSGGTLITLTGTGFYAGISVTVDGNTCTSVNVIDDTSLTCLTPAGTLGTYDIVLTNADTQSSTFSNSFTYAPAPVLSGVNPNSGTTSGGDSVTITGSDFTSTPQVRFDGVDCTNINYISSTSLTCDTPAHAAGFVTVEVINPDTQSSSLPIAYNYLADPVISSISPLTGSTIGSDSVTITGTGFLPGDSITLGGVNCAVNTESSTEITCTTGANTAGVVDVVLNRPSNSQSATLSSGFTYQGPPGLTSINPNGGNVLGGNTVTLTGVDFLPGLSVTIDGVNCPNLVYVSSTELTCNPLAHIAETVDVIVINPDGQSDTLALGYTYSFAPTITSLTADAYPYPEGPLAGATAVTITGTNFVTSGTTTVDFGGSGCGSVVVSSTTTITCTTTAHSAGAVDVTITNPDGQSVVASAAYTYFEAPTVSSLSPDNGDTGNTITINGDFFRTGLSVTINGVACTSLSNINTNAIDCVVPNNAVGPYNLVVTNRDLQSSSPVSFTYNPAPTISGATPTSGPESGGTAVTITGTGFIDGLSITVEGVNCSSVTFNSSTEVICTTPAGTPGASDIVVTNPDGQLDTDNNAFTYIAAPDLVSINPTTGFANTITALTLTGTDFDDLATVIVGSFSCTTVVVNGPNTQITCNSPALAAGTYDITVTNPDGQSDVLASAFTTVNPPVITSVDPVNGSVSGGNILTINGTDFDVDGAGTVDIGLLDCPIISSNSTTITCTIPAQALGSYNVIVNNDDTQTDTLVGGYSYISTAQLSWIVGASSPNPPNPDDYGSTSTNITHTYTLKNIGDVVSSSINISTLTGTPAAWSKGTDTCSGNTLAPAAECTVQMTFLGATLPQGSYSTLLKASATTGGETDNLLQGSVP